MPAVISECRADADPDVMYDALDQAGCLVVHGMADSDTCARVRAELADHVECGEMPVGSVLFWTGGTLHGAGANVTDDEWCYGVELGYSLGWLRQEENQHLSMPAVDAFALPEAVRRRLGFAMDYGSGGLGLYDRSVLAAAKSASPNQGGG